MKIQVRVAYEKDYFLDTPSNMITSHNILRSVDLEPKEDILIMRLPIHEENKKCGCFSCNLGRNRREINWIHSWIRFDIMTKNVRLEVEDGDQLLAVQKRDLGKWCSKLRDIGFPIGPDDLFRFAAIQSTPPKKEIYLFGKDYFLLNKGELNG